MLGHSFRIGGSLRYLLEGVPIEVVMKLGGWTSLCFLIYWRKLELVIPSGIISARLRAELDRMATSHRVELSEGFLASHT